MPYIFLYPNVRKALALMSFSFLVWQITCPRTQAQSTTLTCGDDVDFSQGSLSYSIGQIVFSINEGPDGSSLEGVQQPYEISCIRSSIMPDDIHCYPNPTQNSLVLSIDNTIEDEMCCYIYDLQGRLLGTIKITDSMTIIHMDTLASGVYLLTVKLKNEHIKTLKAIKH